MRVKENRPSDDFRVRKRHDIVLHGNTLQIARIIGIFSSVANKKQIVMEARRQSMETIPMACPDLKALRSE